MNDVINSSLKLSDHNPEEIIAVDLNQYQKKYNDYVNKTKDVDLQKYEQITGYEQDILARSKKSKNQTINGSTPPMGILSKLSQKMIDEDIHNLSQKNLFTQAQKRGGFGTALSSCLGMLSFITPKIAIGFALSTVLVLFRAYVAGVNDELTRQYTAAALGGFGGADGEDSGGFSSTISSFFLKMFGKVVAMLFGVELDLGGGNSTDPVAALVNNANEYILMIIYNIATTGLLGIAFGFVVKSISRIFGQRVRKYFLLKAMNRNCQLAEREEGSTTVQKIHTICDDAYDGTHDFIADGIHIIFSLLQSSFFLILYYYQNPIIATMISDLFLENYAALTSVGNGGETGVATTIISPIRTMLRFLYFIRHAIVALVGYWIIRWAILTMYCDGRGSTEIANELSISSSEDWATSSSIIQQKKLAENYDLNGWYCSLLSRNGLSSTIFRQRSRIMFAITNANYNMTAMVFMAACYYLTRYEVISQISTTSLIGASDIVQPFEFWRKMRTMSGFVMRLFPIGQAIYSLFAGIPEYLKTIFELQMAAIKLEEQLTAPTGRMMTYIPSDKKRVFLKDAKLAWLPKTISLDIDLEELPKWTYVIGPSGGGKTAATDLIKGLRPIQHGEYINYGNFKVHQLSQYPGFVYGTLEQNITFMNEKDIDQEALEKALELANIGPLASRKKEVIIPSSISYSGGQCQRINFARFFYRWLILKEDERPDLLILDEAFSAVDSYNAKYLRSNLNQLNVKYMLVTHTYNVIRPEDQVIYVDADQIIRDQYDAIMQNEHVKKTLLR